MEEGKELHAWDLPLVSPDGRIVTDGMDEASPPLTVRKAVSHALFMNFPGENLNGRQKFERARLGMEVIETEDIQLTSDQITQVKELVAKMYGPVVVYRVWMILDPTEGKKK